MGEVWRADDTNLDREVALKVLPEDVANNPERLSRFEREAKLLAALNHPNIATLFNLEQLDGQQVLVMELVEGQGLDELIDGGSLDLERATAISVQLADALEAAHAQGIVHRDLKPANIKIRPDGAVKVLDFGLAKAWNTDDDNDSLSLSPTITRHATVEGVILGTAAYMSPEQARGQAVDKRADIWAFGVVLWQMLTGRRLFDGDTVSDTLAAVLKEEPDLGSLPPSTPTSIRRLLRRCLQKDTKNRLHDIADARIELLDESEDQPTLGDGPAVETPNAGLRALPWVLAAIAAAIALWMWIGSRGSSQEIRRVVANIPPPAGTEFRGSRGFAVSPNGSQIIYGALENDGSQQLWLHSLAEGTSRVLDGTEGGRHPFWSPEGHAIGFFANNKLKKLTLENGVIEILADAPGRAGGTWSQHGVIVIARRSGMFQIPAAGGNTESVTASDGVDLERLFPSFLPDGKHFLYLSRDYSSAEEKHELRVGSVDGGPHKVIMASDSAAVYAPWGDLLWWQDGHIRAQPFDLDRLELTGEPRLFQADVQFDPRIGHGMFSVALDGTLVYRKGGIRASTELGRVDRQGRDLGAIGDPGNFYHPRLSPDGSMVAVDKSDVSNRGDIWIYDIERGSGTRFTSEPEDESAPAWSPDGSQLTFVSNQTFRHGVVHLRSLRGANDEKVIFGDESIAASPWSWSPTGILVEYTNDLEKPLGDIGVYSVEDGTFTPRVATQFMELHGGISPDGRLIAYQSDETGRYEVYVETYPDPIDRRRVSTDGGTGAVWRRDGRELFFVSEDRELFAAPARVSADGSSIEIGTPELLFTAEFRAGLHRQPFDTVDGQTFVINRSVADFEQSPLTLVVNAAGR
jgi:serine/threonine protein kinase